ncbi:MAG: S1 RNA-binding domain-containing protein [Clostridiales bacterium]|nr:S1 RNA-binding domain-containing protein [Clostridiales bacterium]
MANLYKPEGMLIQTPENREYISSLTGLERAMQQGKILESTALMCDEELNLHIDLYGMQGIMPKNEVQKCGKGEEIKDIAIITRVGKAVCFKVIGFERAPDGQLRAILSRRAAQNECTMNYISSLICGDIIPAKITHMEQFGAFVDIGCGIISLLSVDCISVSRISHPRDRFLIGEYIKVVIKSIDSASERIFVTHRELLGTWEENAVLFSPGQTVAGIVRSIESYGIFVELTPNLAGLAELRPGISPGQTAAVYIKNIIPERMKIKLVIIDTHKEELPIRPPKYFIDTTTTTHIDKWRYSPEYCDKIIMTEFV